MSATRLYRIARNLHLKKIPVIPMFMCKIIRILYSCVVFPTSDLGKEIQLGYDGLGTVIHKNAIIGRKSMIASGVTIEGNTVEFGVHTIGDNVKIGANSVITKSVLSDSVIVGVNRIITKQNINYYI